MLLAKLTPRWSHPAGETHLSVAPCCWRATVEYVPDVEALAQRLKQSCARLIVSYMVADSNVGLARYERRARGWRCRTPEKASN
jgi:hypothetical protein